MPRRDGSDYLNSILALDVFEDFKYDYENGEIGSIMYLDTWDYEYEYSHAEIDAARIEFIEMANTFLESINSPYYMREVTENAMLCYRDTNEIVR